MAGTKKGNEGVIGTAARETELGSDPDALRDLEPANSPLEGGMMKLEGLELRSADEHGK